MNQLISLIVPVYNVVDLLERCVLSLINQSYKTLEVILVDDGSTDGSSDLCDQLAKNDMRIRVIHQVNAGLSAARNKGVDLAKGDLVSFVDSDDYVHRDYLKILYGLINDQVDVAVCGYQSFVDQVKEVHHVTPVLMTGKQACLKIVKDSQTQMIVAWGKLYKKSLLVHFVEGKYHEDEFFTYKVLSKAQNVAVLASAMYYYYQRPSSIMNASYSTKRLDKLEALKEAVGHFDGEMKVYACYRYLLNIQIARYKVMYESDFKTYEKDLQFLYTETYTRYYELIKEMSFNRRRVLDLFKVMPDFLLKIIRLYIKISKRSLK